MEHHFNVDIAKKYGVPVAIVLNHLVFWIQKNKANEKHFHDGRFWTYNSVKAFLVIFPYWTTDQMRSVLEKLKSTGLILIGNYNQKGYDQTLWYALSDEGLKLYNMLPNSESVDNISPIWEKSQMELGKRTNGFVENPKPIPDALAVDLPDTKSSYFKEGKNGDKSSWQKPKEGFTPAPSAKKTSALLEDFMRSKGLLNDRNMPDSSILPIDQSLQNNGSAQDFKSREVIPRDG